MTMHTKPCRTCDGVGNIEIRGSVKWKNTHPATLSGPPLQDAMERAIQALEDERKNAALQKALTAMGSTPRSQEPMVTCLVCFGSGIVGVGSGIGGSTSETCMACTGHRQIPVSLDTKIRVRVHNELKRAAFDKEIKAATEEEKPKEPIAKRRAKFDVF